LHHPWTGDAQGGEESHQGTQAADNGTDEADGKPTMSATLKADLEGYRQQAAQVAIALNPAIAFDLMAFTIAVKCLDNGGLHGGPQIHFSEQYPMHTVMDAKTVAAKAFEKIEKSLPVGWLKAKTESAWQLRPKWAPCGRA
jgi:hypothetical protein